jgi:hypothetical protein
MNNHTNQRRWPRSGYARVNFQPGQNDLLFQRQFLDAFPLAFRISVFKFVREVSIFC